MKFSRKALGVPYSLFLLLFVAIPAPGTGAWTGALIAALMNMKLKQATPIILCGVCIAGLIMTAVTYGAIHIF